ncbi:MAG: hydrolase [Frankiales bacterium]|jgi:predicted amidohydrolase YtcJ|nr:hydrolase [Frankiales bacterium]
MRVDAVFTGGNVLTLDPARPRATALAVLGGRIVAVGDDSDLEGLTADRYVALGGATVVPGFHDAHNHCVFFGMSLAELPLSTPPVQSLADIYEAVARAARTTAPGGWIVGAGYDQNRLAERRHPTAAELDRVAPGHRVWLRHTSGHMAVVNGAVLDAIGIDAVAVPPGGVVERDAGGRPTGLLQESAQSLVRNLVYPYPLTDIVGAIDRATTRYLSEGITSAQEAGIGAGLVAWSPQELAAYAQARATGKLHVRTTLMVAADALHELGGSPDDSGSFGLDLGIATGLGDEWLRIGPVKIFSDGSLLGRTAAMHQPFADEPGNAGYLQHSPEQLRELIVRAHRGGWQIATHAIGDLAVDTVLDCYEEALRQLPRADHRHRIEHCAVADDAAVERIARLGVIPVPQGRFISELGDGMATALGPQRAPWCYRQKSFLDRGIPLPGSSDRPVVQGAPLLGIADAVLQRTATGADFNPQEALTPLQALHAWTMGSAYATFEEHRRGSLVAGKLADFAVLSDDLTTVDPEQIASIQVRATVIGGEVVYEA